MGSHGLVIVVVLIAVLVVMTVRNGLQPNRPTVPAIYLSAIAGTFAVLALVARNWPDLGVWWIAVALLPVVWLRALARVRAHRS